VLLLATAHSHAIEFFNYVAVCIEEVPHTATSVSKLDSDVSQVECCRCLEDCGDQKSPEPLYLTTLPLISLYPLVQVPIHANMAAFRIEEDIKVLRCPGICHKTNPDVVITDPCCQTSILQSIPLSLLQPLQYFLSNFAHFLIPKCYSFPSGKNLFVVWMPVLFYQKLCVVFRGITTIQLFLAQQDVPGLGTKLSINFEPFLVLDQ